MNCTTTLQHFNFSSNSESTYLACQKIKLRYDIWFRLFTNVHVFLGLELEPFS